MKRWIVLTLGLFVALIFGGLAAIGVPPHRAYDAVEIATGVAAKLGCSARFISGLQPEQIAADLSHYSPAMALVSLRFDDQARTSWASLLGLGDAEARYREGLGCTLTREGGVALDELIVQPLPQSNQLWPAGGAVEPDINANQVLNDVLARDNAEGLDTRALVLVANGGLLAEAYADGYSADTALIGWSMTKSLTAIMLGNLVMRGLLDVDEAAVFDRWSQDERRVITVEDLLQMSTGLNFVESYVAVSDVNQMLFVASSASDRALDAGLLQSPGAHFSYSSSTTNLLNRFLQDRLGGTLQASLDHLRRDILDPMGVVSLIVEPDPTGRFVGSSYGYATARDWARIGQLMLADGVINGQRIVTSEWVERATRPNRSANDPRYGYQFWLNRGGTNPRWPALPADAYALNGAQAQTVMVVPSENAVLVRLGWTFGGYPMSQRFAEILERTAALRGYSAGN